MSKPAPRRSTAAAAVLFLAVLLLAAAPASASRAGRRRHGQLRCDPLRDVVVSQTAGAPQPDGTRQYDVTVTNNARVTVWDVRLDCGYRFRYVQPVDPDLLLQVGPGDCQLIDGGAIAAGGTVSFSYASYVRYSMAVVNASCPLHRRL